MTGHVTNANLVRWGTMVAAIVALIGLVGLGFDKPWGTTVSVVACAIALVGVVLMAVGVPVSGSSSSGRQ